MLHKKQPENDLYIQYKNKLQEYHDAKTKSKAEEIRKDLDLIEFKLHLHFREKK